MGYESEVVFAALNAYDMTDFGARSAITEQYAK